ncbi:hypothetical protein [Arthrobacter glacialis]|nr:hypothetical protein [Arthrobacter glacialis]
MPARLGVDPVVAAPCGRAALVLALLPALVVVVWVVRVVVCGG